MTRRNKALRMLTTQALQEKATMLRFKVDRTQPTSKNGMKAREQLEDVERELRSRGASTTPSTNRYKVWHGPWSKGPGRVRFWRGKE